MVQNILSIVSSLDSINDELTIFAEEPWSASARALLVSDSEVQGTRLECEHGVFGYFLEVHIANEFLSGLSKEHATTELERCEALIGYAINDA